MNRTSTALPSASYQANVRKVTLLALLVLLAAVCYMVVAVNFGSQQLMLYSMKIRTPKLVVMLITAFAIGLAPPSCSNPSSTIPSSPPACWV